MEELMKIQQGLNAPKDRYNKFGNYNYRSCEGILEAVKPLLKETDCTLVISDDMISVGNRIYVKATATLTNKDGKTASTTAFAREEEAKKGMDSSQITGAASSYARKYALNGLFCIDDNKDSDATNTHGKDDKNNMANIMQQALRELDAVKTEQEFQDLWVKWAQECPPICANGTEFYNKAGAKVNALRNPNKQSA